MGTPGTALSCLTGSGMGERDFPEGLATEDGSMKSYRSILSLFGVLDVWKDCRSWAIPDGFEVRFCDCACATLSNVSQSLATVDGGICAYRAWSLSLRFRSIAIIRHDRFSTRSLLGNCFFAWLNSFQTSAASSAPSFCIALESLESGGSVLALLEAATTKRLSRRSPWCAARCSSGRSSLTEARGQTIERRQIVGPGEALDVDGLTIMIAGGLFSNCVIWLTVGESAHHHRNGCVWSEACDCSAALCFLRIGIGIGIGMEGGVGGAQDPVRADLFDPLLISGPRRWSISHR